MVSTSQDASPDLLRFLDAYNLRDFASIAVDRGYLVYEHSQAWSSLHNLADWDWTPEQMLGLLEDWHGKGDDIGRAYVLSYATRLAVVHQIDPDSIRNWLKHIILGCYTDPRVNGSHIARTQMWIDATLQLQQNERDVVAAWHAASGDDFDLLRAAWHARIRDVQEFTRLRASTPRRDLLERLRTLGALLAAP